ncbi:hypothetical protein FACS1894122_00280 [Alphaproteobacteria bacterium]|nr:hypothetical protein FACS1894122_00100 [Alphaproteobacteria bacterium]GHT90331.1 hypothetical protein FACS1894122_00280 [Alphaproteobacteria bacterium]
MYALLMEKNVRIFDEKWDDTVVRLGDFLANSDEVSKHKIVIDRADVDFSLETLPNCNILDAYNALKCMRKAAKQSEDIFLLPTKNFNIFKKYEFYVQKTANVTLDPIMASPSTAGYASTNSKVEADLAGVNVSSFKLVTLDPFSASPSAAGYASTNSKVEAASSGENVSSFKLVTLDPIMASPPAAGYASTNSKVEADLAGVNVSSFKLVTLDPIMASPSAAMCASTNSKVEADLAGVNVSSFKQVTLMENIIAAFCKSITEISEKTWWIYVAHHKSSGIKIVAGIGEGIVLSRMLPNTLPRDVANAALDTIKYLRRFGLKDEIKIITTYDNITLENQEVIRIEEYEDVELMLLKFFSTNKNIRSIRNCKNHFRTTLRERHLEISFVLYICIFFEVLCLLYFSLKVVHEKQSVIFMETTTEKIVEDASSNFQFKVNDENYRFIERLIEILKNVRSPLGAFQEVSAIIKVVAPQAVTFSEIASQTYASSISDAKTASAKENASAARIARGTTIKLKTTLNTSLMNKLQQLSNDRMSITVEKTENTRSEYELLDANDSSHKKFEAVICIKMK